MPKLNEQQTNQLKFAEDFALKDRQGWNAFGSKARQKNWEVFGEEKKMDLLLLKSLFVLKQKNAITDETLDRVLSLPDAENGYHELFEYVTDLGFLSANEKDADVKEAMKCLDILKGYFDGVVHERKMNNDPVYAANYLKEQEKKQKADNFAVIEKHLSALDGKKIFGKNLPVANPDDLMKLQFRDLSNEELDQCEAAYDELFKVPATGEILPPERFVARKPMDTNPFYSYHPLCAPAPGNGNETEEAKKIRLKKGKAEVLRALLDPARQMEFRYDDWGDAEVNMFGNQGAVEGRQFLRTTNIGITDSKQWEDAVLKKKGEFNTASRNELTKALANPDPEIFTLDSYDAVNPETGEFDYKKFSVADYGKSIKAASLFDKMFKNVSDKRAEIGFKDIEKDVNYKGASVYGKVKDVLGHSALVNGWNESVIAKAAIVHYLATGNKNLTFKPQEFSKFKAGFIPTLTNKAPYPMLFTGNVMEQVHALKAQQENERNRILKENDDADKAFDQEAERRADEEITRNDAQTEQLTNDFVNALNSKIVGLGAINKNLLSGNARLITEQKNKKKDSEEFINSVSDNKYTHRNLNDLTTRSYISSHELIGNHLIQNYGGNKEIEVEKTLTNAGLNMREFKGDVSGFAIFMYAFGVKGMSVDEVLNMNQQQKFALSKEALDEFAKRPVTGDEATSKGVIQANLAWYGEMVRKANQTVFQKSGITFPDLNRIDAGEEAVNAIFRNEKFGFVNEYARFSQRFIEDWTNKSTKVSPKNRFGINQREEFLKGFAKDALDPLSELLSEKAAMNSIIGYGDAILAYSTNDLHKDNNPNTHLNRIKMVKRDLLTEQYGELSGKSVYSDKNRLIEVGYNRRAICEADFDNQTMDQLSKADEKNAERLLSLKADPDADIPTDLLKDYGILKLATKTAGLHKEFHGSKYMVKELEDAIALINDADKPDLFKFDFNKPENVGNDLDYDNLKEQDDVLDEAESTFDDIFDHYLHVEDLFRTLNDDYKNLILFDRFQINGVSVKDLLVQKTHIKDSDFQELTLRTKLGKAMILHAMADPNAHITLTPAVGDYYAKPVAINNYTNEMHLQRTQEIRAIRGENVPDPGEELRPDEQLNEGIQQPGEEIPQPVAEIPAHMDDNHMTIAADEQLSYKTALRFKDFPHSEEMLQTQRDICGTQPDPKVVDTGYTKQQIDRFFGNACLNEDRESTHGSDFTFYLMGVKGMSFEEAAAVTRNHRNYENHVKDFVTFVKSHPIKAANPGDPALTPEIRQQNIKAWTDLFLNSYEKFKEYRLPDIDYSDPVQVARHQRELKHLSKVGMDYFQEVGVFMKSRYAGEIRLAAGGFEKLQSARSSMSIFNSFSTGLDVGFMKNPAEMVPAAMYIRNAAVARALLKDVSNDIKGKTFGDITKNANIITPKMSLLLSTNEYAVSVTNPDVNTDKAIEYLRGQNRDFENSFLAGQQERVNNWYNMTNSVHADSANKYFADKNNEDGFAETKTQLITLFGQNPDANQLYQTFAGNPDKTLLNKAMDVFSAFDRTNEERILRDAYGVSLLDSIRIDGKTPQELWGEKYNFVENPAEKQAMYAVEILKEYYTGKKPVTIDTFTFDNNGDVRKSGCVMIGKDLATIQRGYVLLNEVSKLHDELTAMKQKLANADRRASEADKNRFRASDRYNEMMTALDECIAASDVNNNNRSLDKLDNALVKLNQKASAYAKERDNLTIREKVKRNSAPRLAKKGVAAELVHYKQANDVKKKLPETIAKIRNLASPLGIMLNEHERGKYEIEQGKFGKIRQYLEMNAAQRGFTNEEARRPVDAGRTWNNENSYRWLTGVNMEQSLFISPTEEQAKQINEAGKLGIALKALNEGLHQGTLLLGPDSVNQKAFDNVGFMGSRDDTVFGIFMIYLMGEKGYDINTLAKILDNGPGADGRPRNAELMSRIERERGEFVRFCADNPVKGAKNLSDEKFTQSIENWSRVFMNATDKLKSYKLPDIDYSNAEQAQNFIPEIVVLRSLGINFGQEFPKIIDADHANKPAKDIFEQKLSAVGGTQKLYDEWLKIQALTDTLNSAYLNPMPVNTDQPIGVVIPELSRTAGYRYAAGEMLNPVKGLSLGEAVEKTGNILNLSSNIHGEFIDKYCPRMNGEPYDFKDSVGFALGENKEAFKIKAAEDYKKATTEIANKSGEYSLSSTGNITDIKFGDIRDRFNALDDTPEAMKEFLKENANEYMTMRAWVNSSIKNGLFGLEQYRFMVAEAGLKYSDCIMIDGKTPGELWGAKYAQESPEEKENLLLAETLRKIARGDSVIETKKFSMGPDGTIRHEGSHLALEKNSKLEVMQDAAINYYVTEKELLSELKEIQKTLQDTQTNKNANLLRNNIRTGSDLYRDLCLKLDKCITLLEKSVGTGVNNKVNRHDVVTALNDFSKANETYFNARKGVFSGPRRDYGRKRLAATVRAYETLSAFSPRLGVYLDNFGTKMVADNKLMSSADSSSLLDKAQGIRSFLGMNKLSEEDMTKAYVSHCLAQKNYDLHAMKGPNIPESKAKVPAEREKYELAFQYLKDRTEFMVRKGNGTLDDVHKLDHLSERTAELAGNPAFLSFMKANEKSCVALFPKIEKKAEDNLAFYNNTSYGHEARYVVMNDVFKNPMDAGQKQEMTEACIQSARNIDFCRKDERGVLLNPDANQKAHERLAEVLLNQILTDSKEGKCFRQWIAKDMLIQEKNPEYDGQVFYNHLKSNLCNVLANEKQALSASNVADTFKKLENGKLKKEAVSILHKSLNQNTMQNNVHQIEENAAEHIHENVHNGPVMGGMG